MLVRMKYSKTNAGRFMSHLDLLRTVERVFRRAELPLAFSEGYNPHPKISFGSALAVGVTSDGEYLDVELRDELSPELIEAKLIEALPSGINISKVIKLDKRTQSLTAQINMAAYTVSVPLAQKLTGHELHELILSVLAQPSLCVDRDGKKGVKQVDIRKGIYHLEGKTEADKMILVMQVQTGSEGNVRPEEVVEALRRTGELNLREGLQIHRLGLFVKNDQVIKTPFEIHDGVVED